MKEAVVVKNPFILVVLLSGLRIDLDKRENEATP